MIIKELKRLYSCGAINRQQFKTFKGQVLAGDTVGCVRGLERKGIITAGIATRLMSGNK